ncbi:MAG: ceramidase domain-containing protein [Bradyrhizobiaceae bacterium]|nr:ceramidase domain-containing protein [Bradyrhizobiaceae bacterium]
MSWLEPVDLYCERTDPSFWAEPINAFTNGAFLIAAALAFVLWRRRGDRDPATLCLIVVTALIGIGSFAFHTLATRGAVLLDVIPIALFVYGYLFLALRRFLNLQRLATVGILLAFIVASEGLSVVLPRDFLNGSVDYLPPLAALITVGIMTGANRVGSSILLATVIFLVSLVFRTIDRAVCEGFPIGTHFIWHLLNAGVLYILLRTAIFVAKESS